MYFRPSGSFGGTNPEWSAHSLGERVRMHGPTGFPDLDGVQVVLFGVLDDPGHARQRSCVQAPDAIRAELYRLFDPADKVRLADLGDLHPGATLQDTQHALADTIAVLVRHNIVPIVLGGGQGHTFAQYLAYERLERTANLVCIDPRFDLGEPGQGLADTSYLSHIVLRQPNYLFNYSNLGFQTYLVDQPGIELMDKLFFDAHRLGEVRGAISEAEPVLRNGDTLSVDMNAIRRSDAPGTTRPGPNGFHGEEICQLMRYAGVSEKITSVGIYEMDPDRDQDAVTAQLAAQMVWCFLDGYRSRTNDLPWLDRKRFTRFRIPLNANEQELVFYKSTVSDRWWMDVPYRAEQEARFERHHLVPCSYADYQMACREEVPDRWWRTFQKLA
ncbi:MAG: formimidoylglutamase [Flavobacteriales bacterium]|nr:formimidoylglutamase [Flavobacteriales bacterium]MCB9179671.1 formimidoylglutamase [Flavobacteriales bacterium]